MRRLFKWPNNNISEKSRVLFNFNFLTHLLLFLWFYLQKQIKLSKYFVLWAIIVSRSRRESLGLGLTLFLNPDSEDADLSVLLTSASKDHWCLEKKICFIATAIMDILFWAYTGFLSNVYICIWRSLSLLTMLRISIWKTYFLVLFSSLLKSHFRDSVSWLWKFPCRKDQKYAATTTRTW